MMRIVITGASRGIGLELTLQAIAAGHHVLAVVRNPENSIIVQQARKNCQVSIS